MPSVFKRFSLYTALSLFAGLGNYLFFPLIKSRAGISGLSDIVAYTSLLAVLAASLVAQQLYAIRHVSGRTTKQQVKGMQELRNQAMLFGVCLIGLYLVFGWPTLHAINAFDAVSFVILPLLFCVIIAANLMASYWHARADFVKLGIFMATSSVLQLLVTASLLHFSPEHYVGLIGLGLGQLVVMVIVLVRSQSIRHFMLGGSIPSLHTTIRRSKELLTVSCIIILMYVFLNLDVFIAKHYLSEQLAGTYSAYSTLLRMLFFAVITLFGLFMPGLIAAQDRDRRKMLYKLSGVLAIATVSASLAAIILYSPFFRLLYGLPYSDITSLRLLLLPTLAALVGVNVLVTTCVLLRKFRMASLMIAVGLSASIIGAAFLPTTLNIGPLSVCIGGLAGLVSAALYWAYDSN